MKQSCPWFHQRHSLWNSVNFSPGTAVLVASTAIRAAGSVSSGLARARATNFQAAVVRQQAERERQIAARKEAAFRREQSHLLAARRAVTGASGIELASGSPLLVSEDFAGDAELQALTIRAGGEDAATKLEQAAVLRRLKTQKAHSQGFARGGALILSNLGRSYSGSKKTLK